MKPANIHPVNRNGNRRRNVETHRHKQEQPVWQAGLTVHDELGLVPVFAPITVSIGAGSVVVCSWTVACKVHGLYRHSGARRVNMEFAVDFTVVVVVLIVVTELSLVGIASIGDQAKENQNDEERRQPHGRPTAVRTGPLQASSGSSSCACCWSFCSCWCFRPRSHAYRHVYQCHRAVWLVHHRVASVRFRRQVPRVCSWHLSWRPLKGFVSV